ncbi:rho guanine nucleotide exchange factor 33-like [Nerophis ophidion]|uniref:rho guanine nucleotide exchange factor 33-like n=1 Tax=Nerophis ophidion TaxID=159077 RepID=UPI002AE01C35|nr:rho guanine nucleotide exchange factor 33-like [Nerophis ophidion]
MKPEEAELITEIAKLQGMVSELKAGFTGALLELAQIQHGDSSLRQELEENKRRCQKRASRLETLVESLREEFGVMRGQVLQMCGDTQRPLLEQDGTAAKESQPAGASGGRSQPEATPAGATWSPCRGKVLLHCFLQGLKAGLTEGTDARQQVALQLLHSEWEYVSTLTALYDKYKPPSTSSSREAFGTCVERLLQRHLLFRNSLQERLSAQHWKSLLGDILVQLVGQNDVRKFRHN